MTFKSRSTELTPAERRAYSALPRETPIDETEEERTVRALRARGAIGARARMTRAPRAWWRATAIVSAAAAGVVAVLQATRLHSPRGNDVAQTSDTVAPADTHKDASRRQSPVAAAGSEQRRQEKTSLLVWY